jgi:hypothetical protein
MGEIQSFTEEHADGAARLYLRSVRGQNRAPGKSLVEYFSQLHLSNPWASPDIPALVYLEKGKVVGALGVVPRTLEFRGRPITIATMSIYMVDPEHRNGPGAIQLLRRALKGPQEFSWTDGASGSVHALWSALGGYSAPLYAFNWIRVLRPLGMARLGLDRIGRAGRLVKPATGLLTIPFDLLLSKAPLAPFREPVSPYPSKMVSAEELLGCIQELGWREPLKPYYAAETFPWLMREVAKNRSGGNLRMMTVSNADGKRTGWFIYYAVRGGASFVLQIGVRGSADFKDTLLALFRDAWQQGSVCVKGASIPQYLTIMTEQRCFFRHPYDRVVIHSKNPEIVAAVRSGDAAITRLDGIGWLRFPGEQWDQ